MSELPRERDFSKYTFDSDEYLTLSFPMRRDAKSGRLVPTDAELIERAAGAIRILQLPHEDEPEAHGYIEDSEIIAKAVLRAVGVIKDV